MELSAIEFFFTFFAICIVIGMIAVLGGVGGGVVFHTADDGFYTNRLLHNQGDGIIGGFGRVTGRSPALF